MTQDDDPFKAYCSRVTDILLSIAVVAAAFVSIARAIEAYR